MDIIIVYTGPKTRVVYKQRETLDDERCPACSPGGES